MINLIDIHEGYPGISVNCCKQLHEACIACLHRSNHKENSSIEIKGDYNENIIIKWENVFNDQIDRTWKDQQVCTEEGAVCISVLLVKKYTSYTIIERSRKGSGVDYWLGNENDIPFKNSARLEISGIFEENNSNTAESRFRKKQQQTQQSDTTLLPAYISVVEFSKPKAIFAKK